MFERIKKWYKQGLWTEDMVQTAADKGIITLEQATEILKGA
jgi:hypothetical protein